MLIRVIFKSSTNELIFKYDKHVLSSLFYKDSKGREGSVYFLHNHPKIGRKILGVKNLKFPQLCFQNLSLRKGSGLWLYSV